ncbi:MAG: hypothetical protein KDE27_27715 [Planctomycetes bacterium]|nr:hypothetical protein [Planctomycetota bacterium]
MITHSNSSAHRIIALLLGLALAAVARAAHPMQLGQACGLAAPAATAVVEASNAVATSTLTVHLINRQGARIKGDVKLVLNGVVVQGWTPCPKATGVTFVVTPGLTYKVIGRPQRTDLYKKNSRRVPAPYAGTNKVTTVTLPRR